MDNITKTTEPMESLEAFELYYAMGDNRTFDFVSEKLCVSVDQLRKYAKLYDWKTKVAARNEDLIKEIKEKLDAKLAKSRVEHLDSLLTMVNNTFDVNEEGIIVPKLSITTIESLEKAMKLINLQTGGATERADVVPNTIQFVIKSGEKVEVISNAPE